MVVLAVILARDILDFDIQLPTYDGGPVHVTSMTYRYVQYVVHNVGESSATYTCVHSVRGNICKHQVKVLKMLHPNLVEGRIARYCRSLKGTQNGGLHCIGIVPPPPSNSPASSWARPSIPKCPRLPSDIHDTLLNQAEELLSLVFGNDTFMQHFHADFNRFDGKLKTLHVDLDTGIIHLSQAPPVFHTV